MGVARHLRWYKSLCCQETNGYYNVVPAKALMDLFITKDRSRHQQDVTERFALWLNMRHFGVGKVSRQTAKSKLRSLSKVYGLGSSGASREARKKHVVNANSWSLAK